MKKKEIEALWNEYPDLFKRAVELEHNAAPNLQSVKGLGRNWSWEEYHERRIEEIKWEEAQISMDDLFPDSPGCLCGYPCGCYDG